MPSLKGAVCSNAYDKEYLLQVAKYLGIKFEFKKLTRRDICKYLEKYMLMQEKYGTKTYVMIPFNHPTLPFPYNLKDRVKYIMDSINEIIKHKLDITTNKLKKTEGDEKGYPSYEIKLKLSEKDEDMINTILTKYKATKIKNEWTIFDRIVCLFVIIKFIIIIIW